MIFELSEEFEEGLNYWKKTDRKVVDKIQKLMESIKEDPFNGIGKPEPLKYELSGCWSRRINKEHRIVYEVSEKTVYMLSCRYHY